MAADKKAHENTEKAVQTYAALGVGFVCLVVGVPLWWKTTEVYRVQLPHADIQNLAGVQVSVQTDVTVIILDEKVGRSPAALFEEKLREALSYRDQQDEPVRYLYKVNVRHAFEEERQQYERSSSLEDFDTRLESIKLLREHGKYAVVMLPADNKFGVAGSQLARRRAMYLLAPTDLESVLDIIKTTVTDVVVNQKLVDKIYNTAAGEIRIQPDKTSMRTVRSHPGYEVTFTLLNPQPDLLDVKWDIKGGITAYLKPFLDTMQKFTDLSVKSQYLYFTGLNIHPQKDEQVKGYVLQIDDLPHVINPIEAQLSSHVSVNPQLNFIVYVPYRVQAPLYILNQNGNVSATNSFLSPRWGGIKVQNIETPEGASLPYRKDMDMKETMEVFLSQLRLLLGVSTEIPHTGLQVLPPGNNGINLWELDRWLRQRAIENVATATGTLRSLVQLLDKVKNIVIRDDIGSEVENAVKAIQKSNILLAKGSLQEAYHASKSAILASEKAFFDPSLLELLYFPEDQKFAIYIPLFLPISIPVILSVLHALKWLRQKKEKTDKVE